MKIRSTTIDEMKALIDSGDLDLSERRKAFKTMNGRDTTLDDDGLIRACAACNDDDEELFTECVIAAEQGKIVIDDSAEAAE